MNSRQFQSYYPNNNYANGLVNTYNRPVLTQSTARRAVTTWKVNWLISNRDNKASHQDVELINPWGIVVQGNQLFVTLNSADGIANYDLFGNKLLATASIREAAHNPSFPTGNCC